MIFYILLPLLLSITYSSIQIVYFFIQYTPEYTLKSYWFLVQVNSEETPRSQINSLHTGDYRVNFLSIRPDDSHLCTRWWLAWYKYHLDNQNVSTYDARMLLGPKQKSNLTKHILWSNSVYLTDSFYLIHDPFTFYSCSDIISTK